MRGFNSIDNLSKAECLRQLQNEVDEDIRAELQHRIDDIDKAELRKETEAYKKCCSISDYKKFLAQYPNSTYKSQAFIKIDDLTFANLRKSKSGCETYLGQYPNGRHKSEAGEKIAKVRRRRIITLIIFIIIVIIFIAGYHPAGSVIFSQNIETEKDDLKVNKTCVCLVVTSSRLLMTPVLAALPQSDHKTVSFSKEGGTKEISVSSNANSDNVEIISNDEWVNAQKSLNGKVKISVSSNSGAKRSGSIVIRAWSTLFGKRISSTDGTIYIEQEAGGATYLNLSSVELSFDDNGGEKTITVDTDYSWSIGTSTASWGHLAKSGNELTLRVDQNTSTDTRTDWFTIKAGQKEKRVNITQNGCVNLSVSSDELSFGSSGGSQTISVYASESWEIGTNTNSWGHLSKNGNQLTIRIDQNTSTSSRTDWFSIKSGGKEKRINISQAAFSKSATITSVNVYNNSDVDGEKGLSIKVSFKVSGMKGDNGNVSCYFYDSDGNALVDSNNRYGTDETTRHVAVSKSICPGYDTSEYTDYEVKIPYSELHQSGTYSRTLKVMVIIWDNSVTPHKQIQRSSYTSFSYTPSVESYLKVDNSTSDKVKNFSESGGRETYYVSTSESSYETWGVPSWCRIESKSSSSFTLVCDPNTSSSERSDYMKVKAGGKEIRIDIKQEAKSGPSASITSIEQEHNVFNGMVKGMRINLKFDVSGMKNRRVKATAWFYYADNTTQLNNPYGGQVSVSNSDTAPYDDTTFTMTLFMPYPSLNMAPGFSGSLSFDIVISDSSGNSLARENNSQFTYSQMW